MRYQDMDNDLEKRLFDFIENSHAQNILDFGCGKGSLLNKIINRFPNLNLTGIDFFSKFADDFKTENTNNKIKYLDIESPEFQKLLTENNFDLIISTFTLHHFKLPVSALNQMYNLLNNNGKLWLCDFSLIQSSSGQKIANILSYFDEIRQFFKKSYHRHYYSKDEAQDLLSAFSFKNLLIEEITYDMQDSDLLELKNETLERINTVKNSLKYAPDFEKSFFSKISEIESDLLKNYSPERNTLLYITASR
jgi:ubiquinone/menaquinone biosynthesis C-methylase UbiE